MSVVDSDIQLYGAANMPEDDDSLVGGAVDLGTKVSHVALAAPDTIDVQSDNPADTDQTYTISGYNVAGDRITVDYALNGASLVLGATTLERIGKIVKTAGSALAGTVTWKLHTGGATIVTMEGSVDAAAGTEIDTVRVPFYNLASDPDDAKVVFSKVFARNNEAVTTLSDAQVQLMDGAEDPDTYDTTVDATSAKDQKVLSVASTVGIEVGDAVVIATGTARTEIGEVASKSAGVSITLVDNLVYAHTLAQADTVVKSKVDFEIEEELDGTDTSVNRITTPAGYAGYAWSGRAKNLPNSQNHTAGSVIGLWIRETLAAGDDPEKTEIQVLERGNSV